MRTSPFFRLSSLAILAAAAAFGIGEVRAATLELVAGGGQTEKNAAALSCRLKEPFGVEFLPSGEMLVVEMTSGNRVLKVDRSGILTQIAGTGAKGLSGDGGPALGASFNGIHNLAVTPAGDILLCDSFNNLLRGVDARTGIIRTLAGGVGAGASAAGATTNSEPALDARFSTLIQIALEPSGRHLLMADIGHRRICRLDLASGMIETVAGNGQRGVPSDGAPARQAPLVDPRAVVADGASGFYILERGGNALRHVDAAGVIRTVAGTGKAGDSGDGGPALQATFNGPKHLCMDRDGSVLIADAENHVVRRYSPATGMVTRVAGTGKAGMGATGGEPLQTALRRPHGVTVGPDGMLYITDSYNDRVLRLVP